MKLERLIQNGGYDLIAGLFSVSGSFGIIDGTVTYDKTVSGNTETYTYENGALRLVATFTHRKDGCVLRQDRVENVSDAPVILNRVRSRFTFEGGEYQIYSQSNNWQHENVGRWQPLAAEHTLGSLGIRSCDGATPMLALENAQSGKLTVFHLFPNCQWRMWVHRCMSQGVRDTVTVECGLEDSALALEVAVGETITLPEIFFYYADSRLSFDSYKLHNYMNEAYPKRSMPVLYDTWMMNFDFIHPDKIFEQARVAAELGIEVFCIDAGWFGAPGKRWADCVGDWKENMTEQYAGRVRELSDYVRSLGMKFGIWLEPERAAVESTARTTHPEQYIRDHLLDFADDAARERIYREVCEVIDLYGVEFVKFDFNSTVAYDPRHTAFYRYAEGSAAFVRALKERYPDLYLCNCASGGLRADLESCKLYDSIWISDNHSQHDGLRIFTDYMRRLPPSRIEKWNVQMPLEGVPNYMEDKKRSVIVSCNNASWDFVISVRNEYTFGFLTGGVLGYSCDLAAFPAWYVEETKAFIKEYKARRDYFKDSALHILTDTDNLVVLEYFNEGYEEVYLQLFTKLAYQETLTVYPKLPRGTTYRLGEETLTAEELMEDGIVLSTRDDNNCTTLILKKA